MQCTVGVEMSRDQRSQSNDRSQGAGVQHGMGVINTCRMLPHRVNTEKMRGLHATIVLDGVRYDAIK